MKIIIDFFFLSLILSLSSNVQVVLLQRSWFDVFVLGLSQCGKLLSLNSLLANLNLKFQTINISTPAQRSLVNEQLFLLQTFVTECERLKITPVEYAYLKLIALFDAGMFSFLFFFQVTWEVLLSSMRIINY